MSSARVDGRVLTRVLTLGRRKGGQLEKLWGLDVGQAVKRAARDEQLRLGCHMSGRLRGRELRQGLRCEKGGQAGLLIAHLPALRWLCVPPAARPRPRQRPALLGPVARRGPAPCGSR